MAISSDECDDLKTIYKITIFCYTLEMSKQTIKHTYSPLIRKKMVYYRLKVFFSLYISLFIDRIIAVILSYDRTHLTHLMMMIPKVYTLIKKFYCECMKK
jgi:hypothetical protein